MCIETRNLNLTIFLKSMIWSRLGILKL